MNHPPISPLYFQKGVSHPYFVSPKIQVQEVEGKGLGVIALGSFDEGEVIEVCPTILLKYDKRLKWGWLKRFYRASVVTIFDDYLWWWKARKQALLLGYGNLYNHSDQFNVKHHRVQPRKFVFVANRSIAAGEELTIHYGAQPFCFSDTEKGTQVAGEGG